METSLNKAESDVSFLIYIHKKPLKFTKIFVFTHYAHDIK